MLAFFTLLAFLILTALLFTGYWNVMHKLDDHETRTKLLDDEVKRMQRWILNHRYLEPESRIVRLPEDKMISKIPRKEDEEASYVFAY